MSSSLAIQCLSRSLARTAGCRPAACLMSSSVPYAMVWSAWGTPVRTFAMCSPAVLMGTRLLHAPKAAAGRDLDADMPHSDHFDVQDIDASRLTHYYWDKDLEEDAMSPYDYAMLLDEMSEWDGESLQFVEIDDRELLNAEYLK